MDDKKKEILDDRKKEILELALQFFKEHEGARDHIDEIVKYCKMSKATFYNLFKTKESFLMELVDYTEKAMEREIDRITFDKLLSGQDKFAQKTVVIVDYWSRIVLFRSFLVAILAFEHQDLVIKERQKSLEKLYDQYQIMLADLYGEETDHYLWDMVFQLNAYINIFIQIRITQLRKSDEKFMLDLILSALQALKDRLMLTGGMLDRSFLYFGAENPKEADTDAQNSLTLVLSEVKAFIRTQELNCDKSKLVQALDKIEEEINSGEQDSYLTEAMLALLEKEAGLQDYIPRLKKCIQRGNA